MGQPRVRVPWPKKRVENPFQIQGLNVLFQGQAFAECLPYFLTQFSQLPQEALLPQDHGWPRSEFKACFLPSILSALPRLLGCFAERKRPGLTHVAALAFGSLSGSQLRIVQYR